MTIKNEPRPEISAKTEAFQENSSKTNSSMLEGMARGAGFEPARPVRTTGLAGLPPTRLGQPRSSAILSLLS